MKKRELKETSAKNVADLKKKVSDHQKERINTTIELKMGKTKNVHVLKKIKRDIAQLKTVLNLKMILEDSKAKTKTKEIEDG